MRDGNAISPTVGSADHTVRIWELESGRCFATYDLGEEVRTVAWNPNPVLPIVAACAYVGDCQNTSRRLACLTARCLWLYVCMCVHV